MFSFSIGIPPRPGSVSQFGWVITVLLAAMPLVFSQQSQVRQEEKVDYYRRWLEQDVVYLITEEERDVFSRLTTSVEKDRFIEQFWARRDSDARTAVNEFKEEHYRRLTYANEQFRSGVDGWATDRGRIYIMFGEPDSIERHPTGGRYDRPLTEGGGSTTTFPFEVWTYNYVKELDRPLTVEFVDPLGTSEYRIALHDSEKDALLYVSGQGRTLAEIAGLETRAGRIRGSLHLRGIGLKGDSPLRESDNPFDAIERYFDLRRPPKFRFPELREVVASRVFYQTLPVKVSVHRRWIDSTRALVALTLHVPASELVRPDAQQVGVNLDFYGTVQTLNRATDYEFEEQLWIPELRRVQEFVFQKKIPLGAGRYKLTMVIRDRHSDRLATPTVSVFVPKLSSLALSDVVLTDRLVAMKQEGLDEPFTTRTGLKVYPLSEHRFSKGQRLAFFFEIYNSSTDSATGQAAAEWRYGVVPEGTPWVDTALRPGQHKGRYQDTLAVAQFLSTAELTPGIYLLRIEVEDRLQRKSERTEIRFEITG